MARGADDIQPIALPRIRFVAGAEDAAATPRASALVLSELVGRLGLVDLINDLGMGKDNGVAVEHVVLTYLLMSAYGATSVHDLVEQVREDTALAEVVGGIEQITDRVLGYYNKLHEVETLEELLDRFVGDVQRTGRFESRADGVIATDDSTLRKFGESMEHIAVVYDHCDKLYYLGYVLVSTCYCDSTRVYPINFEFRIQTDEERRRAEEARLKADAELDFRKKGALHDWLNVLAANNRLPSIMTVVGNFANVENFKLLDARNTAWVAEAREQLPVRDIAGNQAWSWDALRNKTLSNKPDVSEVEGLKFYTKEVSLHAYDREVDFVVVTDFAGQTLLELLMHRLPHQQRVERVLSFMEREGHPEATKLDIAARLIRRAKEKSSIKAETVAADAWYFVAHFVVTLLGIRGIKRVVSKLKVSQLVTYLDRQLSVQELWSLPNLVFRHDRKNHFKWATLTAHVAGLGPVRLVLVKELDESRPWRVIAQYVLVCTDINWSPSKIVSAYKLRWGIEVFYRTAKQRFSLKDFHSPSFLAIHFHVTFVFLAYLMAAALRQLNPALAKKTLGEVIDLYRSCLVALKTRGNEIIVTVGPSFAHIFGLDTAR